MGKGMDRGAAKREAAARGGQITDPDWMEQVHAILQEPHIQPIPGDAELSAIFERATDADHREDVNRLLLAVDYWQATAEWAIAHYRNCGLVQALVGLRAMAQWTSDPRARKEAQRLIALVEDVLDP